MSKNWVEKAAKEIEKQINNWQFTGLPGEARRRKAFADIVLSHAPVIDAEKLAEALLVNGLLNEKDIENDFQKVIAVITSNLDLSVDWVDGKAEWGQFELGVYESTLNQGKWNWTMLFNRSSGATVWLKSGVIPATATEQITDADLDTQEDAQQAGVSALKRIVCGVKG